MAKPKVLIVGPSLSGKGGVSLYYATIFPDLKENDEFEIEYFSVGSSSGRGVFFDVFLFLARLISFRPLVVHVNTSLNWKGFLRDGVFLFLASVFRHKRLVFFRGWSLTDEETSTLFFKLYFWLCYSRSQVFCYLASDVSRKLRNGK